MGGSSLAEAGKNDLLPGTILLADNASPSSARHVCCDISFVPSRLHLYTCLAHLLDSLEHATDSQRDHPDVLPCPAHRMRLP
jgi:hypothetical protein